MNFHKRKVEIDGVQEPIYVFDAPLEILSDVFAVEVRSWGDMIRATMDEVLSYEHDSAFFTGTAYEFVVYRDVTLIGRVYDETETVLAEVDTARLYQVIGLYLNDHGQSVDIADWEIDLGV